MRPAAYAPISGAERTVFAGGSWDRAELRAFSKMEWQEIGLEWKQYEAIAKGNASRDFANVEIRWDRDKRKVIRFAELRIKEPLMSSAILAPEFGERFRETLGEILYVAVPNRYQALVFPKEGGVPMRYSKMILHYYQATAYPVSIELFEWSAGGLRAVGIFESP